MERWTLRRRIRAARNLAGMERAADLAAAINERGLSRSRIYEIEQGKGPAPGRRELWAIANACGLPLAWFEVEDLGAAVAAGATLDGAEQAARAAQDAARQHEQRHRERPEDESRRAQGDR